MKLNTIFNFNYFNFVHSINELTIDDKILKLIKTITIYGINLNIIIEFILKKKKLMEFMIHLLIKPYTQRILLIKLILTVKNLTL